MKILIAADMEGATGVVHWDHVDPGHDEYKRFRRLMTADVNAAIRAAFDGGAEQVKVVDGHAHKRNVLIEELDARARLYSGGPVSLAMVHGVQSDVDTAMFIGYHARAGSQNAILDHTWSSKSVSNLWLNDRLVGELGLNAAVCGHFGVPILLVSGDQSVSAEATELLGDVETAVVKWAEGRMGAECLPPQETETLIYDAAIRAVQRFEAGQSPAPLRLSTPVRLAVEFTRSEMADQATLLPGAERTAARRIEYTASDTLIAYRAFQVLVVLA
jgi:D-amino peptidase